MRVTNSMLVSNFMNDLNNNMKRLEKFQSQLTSGKKYAHISDNPTSVIYSSEANYKLGRLAHFRSGVENAQDWLAQVETSVMEINQVLTNVYEACIDGSTDVKGESDKKNVSEYIMQMRDHIVTTLNSTFGDKYIFGGYNTIGDGSTGPAEGPFKVDDVTGHLLYNGCDLSDPANASLIATLKEDVLSFSVGPGIDMQATINGIDLVMFGSDGENIFGLLDELYTAVENGDSASEIGSVFIGRIQSAQNHLLAKTAEIGGRTNRLDLLASRYDQDEINYYQMKSDAEDADMAEVIMNQKMAEAVYKAALSAGASVIQPTLMDFLR